MIRLNDELFICSNPTYKGFPWIQKSDGSFTSRDVKLGRKLALKAGIIKPLISNKPPEWTDYGRALVKLLQ